MSDASTPPDLAQQIKQLQQDRQTHEQALAQIDRTLSQIGELLVGLGIGTPAAVSPPAVPASAPRRRRGRRQFDIAGDQFILQVVGELGNPTTAEVNARWQASGRGGSANKALSELVAKRKVKREKVEGGQGSRYTLIGKPEAPKAAAAPTTGKRRKRGRGAFSVTGEQSVLAFIKEKGHPTTSEINAHWIGEGRARAADDTLTKLVNEKRIKREPNKEGRGSRYSLV